MIRHRAIVVTALLFAAGSAQQAAPETPAQPTPATKAPFRLVFKAYDGDPKKDPIEKFSFQVDTIDLRQPSAFLGVDDLIAHTPFKLNQFTYKSHLNAKTGEEEDVSELTLINVKTGKTVVLILNKVVDAAAVDNSPATPAK